ncbi:MULTISPECIES: C40 family peptidase [Streptosporangium]|uniref:CHAP domain-containing protein n=1 Tax=Streptosporangium brasiliense TaxID=47480 RepID=A0ABT9RM95_9ACTN|nr:peptidoglycan-binding protein [Streptosporangium brasiliense]MDP9870406.1 hypothetical protein [Streptosporangium brasiliense]
MSFTAEQLIRVAKSYEGYAEKNGATKFGQWYGDRQKNSAFDKAAWCDMFVVYCAHEAGGEEAVDIVGEYAYTPHHAAWFARNGRWGAKPTLGAIGFIDWSGTKIISAIDHVVIVLGTDARGRVVTIEGNTADQVAIRYRDRSLFVGFGYPKYAKAGAPIPPPVATKPVGRPAAGDSAPKFPLAPDDWFSQARNSGKTKPNNGVRRLQARLKERGWSIEVDGRYGPKTAQVVRAFQDEHRLSVDGAVGRLTWAALWNAPIS